MLDISTIEKYDLQKMYKVYDKWPEIAKDSYESNLEPADFHDIDHIIFAGMGGSGAIGDLFSSVLSKTKIHVNVVKGYILPSTVDSNTLVITVSVSGNTAEALAVLDSAYKRKSKIIAFSSGGKMLDYCTKNKINHRKIKSTHSARSSFVKFTYSILNVLNSILPIDKNEVLESIRELDNIKKQISSNNLSNSNPAINLASWINNIPLIYYPYGLQSVAIRFKSSLQENTKTHAVIEDIIETSHNGIVAWERSSTIQPILLRGYDDHIKTKERYEIFKEYFLKNKIDFMEIHSVPGNILTKMIALIYLLDYVSIYKAILLKIDPSPVHSIDFIKSKIR